MAFDIKTTTKNTKIFHEEHKDGDPCVFFSALCGKKIKYENKNY